MPGPPPCHYHPFIFCIVGRGLDRLTAHNERRQPAKLARSCGCLPCRGKHCSLPDFAPLNRGPTLTTPHLHGRRGRRPLQHNPQGFSLPQTSAAAWGQAALHPTLPHSVGRAFARNSFTPPCRGRACPARSLAITTPFILCIVGRGLDPSAGRRGRRPLQHNPQGFSLRQTSAAAWGQAALHHTFPYSVGRAFAHNSFTPPCRGRACPARNPAITTPLSFCIAALPPQTQK